MTHFVVPMVTQRLPIALDLAPFVSPSFQKNNTVYPPKRAIF